MQSCLNPSQTSSSLPRGFLPQNPTVLINTTSQVPPHLPLLHQITHASAPRPRYLYPSKQPPPAPPGPPLALTLSVSTPQHHIHHHSPPLTGANSASNLNEGTTPPTLSHDRGSETPGSLIRRLRREEPPTPLPISPGSGQTSYLFLITLFGFEASRAAPQCLASTSLPLVRGPSPALLVLPLISRFNCQFATPFGGLILGHRASNSSFVSFWPPVRPDDILGCPRTFRSPQHDRFWGVVWPSPVAHSGVQT